MKRYIKRLHINKAQVTKLLLLVVALALFVGAAITFANSQNVKAQQARQAQQSVANHTQTLNQIADAVAQLKQNNQINHDTTIKYINCVLVGISSASSKDQILAVYQACLAGSGIQNPPSSTSSPSQPSPPAVSSTTSTTPTAQPAAAAPVQAAPTKPSQPLICSITLGLLGCKNA